MINEKHYSWQKIEEYVLDKISYDNYSSQVSSDKIPYSIIMPPPNITGYLHMGHALVTTIQDILIRYKRMKGFDTLWQPGVDHAGIATQIIVEKQLLAKNIKLQDIGREQFVQEVYKWKEDSASTIENQIKKMGASCDFSYMAFTMDEQSVRGVNKAFIQLYNDGLIYQDNRLVNWDCKIQTAISDLEVQNMESVGKLYYLKYKIANQDDYIVIATTRPETIFADTAVAVNSLDERYTHLISTEVVVPLINKKIKIIVDDYAKMDKGSGAVKITPAHDFNDFEVGKRNNLEVVNILHKDGTLNQDVPEQYRGLTVQEARKKIIIDLEEANLLEKIEETVTSIPYGDRSGTVIEPMLTKQWFINAEVLAKQAIEVVKNGKMEFVPKQWENLYFEWMNNIQPWCISRQLWWGHRLPVYYASYKNETKVFVAESLSQALKDAQAYYKTDIIDIQQEEDVLDTWFSSSLWPFVTMGWPDDTDKLKKYYPTDVLVTAFDIIFFWVARMIMMGLYFTKQVPFKKVYIHALIRDEHGQKMSKSKGNVVDPLDIMDKYGTDALRFTLVALSGQGRDIKLAEKNIENYKHFITKIWNSYKFSSLHKMNYNSNFDSKNIKIGANKWILHKLENLKNSVDEYFDDYKFNEVANVLYHFIWNDYCDHYLELVKPILYGEQDKTEVQETMGLVFDGMLKLLHPIMPYVTQYLFEQIHSESAILCKELVPDYQFNFSGQEVQDTNKIIALIAKVRNIKADFNIAPSAELQLLIEGTIPQYIAVNIEIIKKILRLKEVLSLKQLDKSAIQDVVNDVIIGIPASNVTNLQQEKDRLLKNQEKTKVELEKILSKLNNEQFMKKANKEVVSLFNEQRVELEEKLAKAQKILDKIFI